MSFLDTSWADIIITIFFGYLVIDMVRTISKLRERVKTLEEDKEENK